MLLKSSNISKKVRSCFIYKVNAPKMDDNYATIALDSLTYTPLALWPEANKIALNHYVKNIDCVRPNMLAPIQDESGFNGAVIAE